MRIFLIVVAALGPAVALVFASHALWYALADAYSPAWGSGGLALAWLLAGSIAAIVALVLQARRRRKAAAAAVAAAAATGSPATGGIAAMLPGGMGAAAPKAIRTLELAMARKPLQTTALLVGFGAVLGRKPGMMIKLARLAAASRM
ncbi:MAG: hypothetical protein ACOC05_10940 [Oceanicaulis sp.]